MKPKGQNNDWIEWRKHILLELKRLSKEGLKHSERLDKYNEILVRNTASLEEHVKRTNLLETKVAHIDEHVAEARTIVSALRWFVSKDNLIVKLLLAGAMAAVAVLLRKYS